MMARAMIKLYGVKPSNYYSLAKASRVYLAATTFAGTAMCSKEAFPIITSSKETKSSKTPLPLMTANAG